MRIPSNFILLLKNCLENEEKKVFGKGYCADRYVVGLDNRAW